MISFTELKDSSAPSPFFLPLRCSHCRQLEPQWILLSKELQAEGIQTAKINGPENPILMTRFAVAGFPSIFFLKGGSTWAYQGPRNVQEVCKI